MAKRAPKVRPKHLSSKDAELLWVLIALMIAPIIVEMTGLRQRRS
ncbi:hypothetical protein [Bradyrhizobium sp. URHC0002]